MRAEIFAPGLSEQGRGPFRRRDALGEPATGPFERPRLEDRHQFGELRPAEHAQLSRPAIGDQLAELQTVNPAPDERKPPVGHQPLERAGDTPRIRPIARESAQNRRRSLAGNDLQLRARRAARRPRRARPAAALVRRGRSVATPPHGQHRAVLRRHDLQRKCLADPRLGVVAMHLVNPAAPLGGQEDAAAIGPLHQRVRLVQSSPWLTIVRTPARYSGCSSPPGVRRAAGPDRRRPNE